MGWTAVWQRISRRAVVVGVAAAVAGSGAAEASGRSAEAPIAVHSTTSATAPLQLAMAPADEAREAVPEKSELIAFHKLHVGDLAFACSDCHRPEEGASAGEELRLSVRPGHDACQDCHNEVADAEERTVVCTVCHSAGGSEVEPFPSGAVTLAKFSHAAHVDPQARVGAQGVRQDCVFCHRPTTSERVPLRPDHPQCAGCHAGGVGAAPMLALDDGNEGCLGCHSLAKIDAQLTSRAKGMGATYDEGMNVPHAWKTAKGSPYRDIKAFPHDRHVQRRDGTPIDCVTCHASVAERSDVTAALAVPAMKECASCHDNAGVVRAPYLTKRCDICHTKVNAEMHPLPSDPVSPQLVHTDAFRRLHNLQAAEPDALCGSCHTGTVNASVDQCAGCHSSMQPRSHLMARFNDNIHGRHAAFDRKQCATCHTGAFCSSCHESVMPRTHEPLASFRAGGHRQAAALNLRSCFTCHDFERTCAECHARELRP